MYYPGTLGRRAQRYQPIDQKIRTGTAGDHRQHDPKQSSQVR
jgi:hypothetical protein